MGVLDLFKRKAEPARVRSFDGAAGGRRASGMGHFGRINPEVAAAAPSLRSRASYLANNNPWLNQACANWTGALVGAGIVPTARHPDPAQRKAINAYFEQWAAEADAEGRTDWWGLQSIVADSMVKAGEAVALILDTEEGPRLRIVPADLLDESKTADLSDGRSIFSGVELDANGRRVAFWIIWPCRCCSTPGSGAATWCAWAVSTSATASCRLCNRRPGRTCISRFTPS